MMPATLCHVHQYINYVFSYLFLVKRIYIYSEWVHLFHSWFSFFYHNLQLDCARLEDRTFIVLCMYKMKVFLPYSYYIFVETESLHEFRLALISLISENALLTISINNYIYVVGFICKLLCGLKLRLLCSL